MPPPSLTPNPLTPPLIMYHHHLYVYLGGPNTAKTTTTTLGPTCVAPNWAVDTTQNATQTPESPPSAQAIHTKTTAGTGAATATVNRVPRAPLDNVRKRLSALRRLHASHQDPLPSVTIQVTINHTAKIVGRGGSTLLLSARDGFKEGVSLVRGCVGLSTAVYKLRLVNLINIHNSHFILV